jgi:S-layer homology domain
MKPLEIKTMRRFSSFLPLLPFFLLLMGLPAIAADPLIIEDSIEQYLAGPGPTVQPDSTALDSAIAQVVAAKLMSNTSDGKFHAEIIMSRAEIATILVKAFNLETLKPTVTAPAKFNDVSSSHWAAKDIEIAVRTGTMEGYEKERFFPNQRVNRAEAFAIFANAYGVFQFPDATIDEILSAYPDAKDLPKWSRRAMATALNEGFVNLGTESLINPLKPMTRGDMAYALSKFLEKERGRYPMNSPLRKNPLP